MSTSKEYLHFILDQLSELEEITHRQMMGEYMLYYRGKIIASLCDDRLMVKPLPSALAMMPAARREPPYPGATELLVVENVDDRAFLTALFEAIYPELPEPKPKKRKANTQSK